VVCLWHIDSVADEQVLVKITSSLDAVDCAAQTMFIAATTFPDRVDPSLTAPGRFTEQVTVCSDGSSWP